MKKWFYIAILAVAAIITGCTKVEVVNADSKVVSFTVGSYAPQTKANVSLLGDTESFSSRAFLHAEGLNEVQEFFGTAGETITWQSGTKEWTPSHDYYWPKSAGSYINFVSWYGGSPSVTETTFTWNNTELTTGTENLMWADKAWRYNDNAKVYPNLDDATVVNEGVPTLFHHALARVRFTAKQTKDVEGSVSWAVTVNSLSLSGVKNKGTLSLTNEVDPNETMTVAWSPATPAWTFADGTANYIKATAAKDLSTAVQEVIPYKSVFPQAVTDVKVNISYTVVTTYDLGSNNTKVVSEDVTKNNISLSAFTPTITAWAMNSQITYNININPDTQVITIIPVEANWAGDNDEYPINIE